MAILAFILTILFIREKKSFNFWINFLISFLIFTLNTNLYFGKRIQSIFKTDVVNWRAINLDSNIFEYKENNYFRLWFYGFEVFKENPYFGVGLKKFRDHCVSKEIKYDPKKEHPVCTTHPHNYIIEILSELGLFGF